MKIDPYLSCTKLKSKWIEDLNIKPTTLNHIEEKVGSTLERVGTGDHLLIITPVTQTLRTTINKQDIFFRDSVFLCSLDYPRTHSVD